MIGEDVIAKAVEAMLRSGESGDLLFCDVLTFDEYKAKKAKNQYFWARKVDVDAFHQLTCANGILGEVGPVRENSMQIYAKVLTGRTFTIECNSTTTIGQ